MAGSGKNQAHFKALLACEYNKVLVHIHSALLGVRSARCGWLQHVRCVKCNDAVDLGNLCFDNPALFAQRTADERFEARQEAARGAVNIDWEERQRRIVFGGALLVLSLSSSTC